ncbi:hypothetical protein LDO31_11760 [Luteimonas sp. XNQY3]|nr:hypothetical protein [Luteimonas sp. XNQY3]MCD9006901.1 hypothetical protein [Luteimonas sp. XNQY3]
MAPSGASAQSFASATASPATPSAPPRSADRDQTRATASAERSAPAANAKLLLARARILDHLCDPSTARFRHGRQLQGGEIVCLAVNSKNGFGGDIGFTQAVVISRPEVAPVVWGDEARQHIARAACETT